MGKPINQRPPQLEKSVWSRAGIGLEEPEVRRRKDARLGSQILREACLDLFCRLANDSGIALDDVLTAYRNERSRIPGTERVYRGQAAERMAA